MPALKMRHLKTIFLNYRHLSVFCFIIALSSFVSVTAAQKITFFRIGTGSTSGTYFPIGTLIGSAITGPPGSRPCDEGGSCGVPGLIAAAQTTRGSISNIQGVLNGNLETGLAQSDIVYAAFHGEGTFDGKRKSGKNLRVIANLYPENVHLVVRKKSGIGSIVQMKGKRISIDLPGSGTRENAQAVLRANGIGAGDYIAVAANADKAVQMLRTDELDAFFFVAGYPVEAIAELAEDGLIDLLSISGEASKTILKKHQFLSLSNIPAETYEGIGEISTLAVSTQWIVNANMNEELVYAITKSLWHPRNRVLLDGGHLKGKLIRLETALKGISTPLHPGARRFYSEQPWVFSLTPDSLE